MRSRFALTCILVFFALSASAATEKDFPLGVFEDAPMIEGDPKKFQAMLEDLKAHGLDSVMIVNGDLQRDKALLSISDQVGMNAIIGPSIDLERDWWPSKIPATPEKAKEIASRLVNTFGKHESYKAYYIADEPALERKNKLGLLIQALKTLDPQRPAFPILIGIDRVGPILSETKPGRLVLDVYPCGWHNPIGDFTMNGFGYKNLDFISYVRYVTTARPEPTPLWMILQTHRLGNGGAFSLREPTVNELKSQTWLAIGEGATGIFWFIYSSQQGWRGLKDNSALYDEVARLAKRIGPLRSRLIGVKRTPGFFKVVGKGPRPHYISDLVSADQQHRYIVVVNRDAQNARSLQINGEPGKLRDLESDKVFEMGANMGANLEFAAGDGRIFEFEAAAKP